VEPQPWANRIMRTESIDAKYCGEVGQSANRVRVPLMQFTALSGVSLCHQGEPPKSDPSLLHMTVTIFADQKPPRCFHGIPQSEYLRSGVNLSSVYWSLKRRREKKCTGV
jgi:hypothetical protein